MEVGVVKVAEDSDFELLKTLINEDESWKLDYKKGTTTVWTKGQDSNAFKMVKLRTSYTDIDCGTMYDVLHDPDYRKVWDKHMIDAYDIGCLNPNNDVGYYAMSCPPPIKDRDFVLQRSWLDTGKECLILNHSVYHKDYPVKKEYIRGISYITGFLIQPLKGGGCSVGYVSHSHPGGTLPSWLVNKVTQIFAPKMVKQLHKAAVQYEEWKSKSERPNWKPWVYPEQMEGPRVKIEKCVPLSKDNISLNNYSPESSPIKKSKKKFLKS